MPKNSSSNLNAWQFNLRIYFFPASRCHYRLFPVLKNTKLANRRNFPFHARHRAFSIARIPQYIHLPNQSYIQKYKAQNRNKNLKETLAHSHQLQIQHKSPSLANGIPRVFPPLPIFLLK